MLDSLVCVDASKHDLEKIYVIKLEKGKLGSVEVQYHALDIDVIREK
jgi:hypothetical protein